MAGNESQILAPTSDNGPKEKLEKLDSISNNSSDHEPHISKKSVTLLPQLLPTKEDSKAPILAVKSKLKREDSKSDVSLTQVPNFLNRHKPSENPKSPSPTPALITKSPSPTPALTSSAVQVSAQTRKVIERHKSSDSILTSPSLPPVNRRRHSSQDRLGRFSVKSSAVEANQLAKTTNPNVPITLPPRPKVSKTKISDNSKLKFTRSLSGNHSNFRH